MDVENVKRATKEQYEQNQKNIKQMEINDKLETEKLIKNIKSESAIIKKSEEK